MSDATLRLLSSTSVLTAIAIGATGVSIMLAWVALARRPFPVGGVVLATGAVLAMVQAGRVSVMLVIGLLLLVLVGLAPSVSPYVTMAIIIPGAAVIGISQSTAGRGLAPGLVAITIVVLAPLVAWFDERYAASTVGTPLMAMSVVSVFLTVPDTDVAVLAAGAALPWLMAGPPANLAKLGRAGAFSAVGLLVWLVATGGFARPVSVVAGIATLGVLVAVPVGWLFRTRRGLRDGPQSVTSSDLVPVVGAHVAIQAVIAVVIRL
ncbi:MAG: hypothetical protein ABFR53_02810 [Actinomycetota bacterium]